MLYEQWIDDSKKSIWLYLTISHYNNNNKYTRRRKYAHSLLSIYYYYYFCTLSIKIAHWLPTLLLPIVNRPVLVQDLQDLQVPYNDSTSSVVFHPINTTNKCHAVLTQDTMGKSFIMIINNIIIICCDGMVACAVFLLIIIITYWCSYY